MIVLNFVFQQTSKLKADSNPDSVANWLYILWQSWIHICLNVINRLLFAWKDQKKMSNLRCCDCVFYNQVIWILCDVGVILIPTEIFPNIGYNNLCCCQWFVFLSSQSVCIMLLYYCQGTIRDGFHSQSLTGNPWQLPMWKLSMTVSCTFLDGFVRQEKNCLG